MMHILPLMKYSLAAAVLCISASSVAAECVPSPWGVDDEIGAANRVNPERTLAAAQLIKKGESHPLGIVLDPNMPAFPPRFFDHEESDAREKESETPEAEASV